MNRCSSIFNQIEKDLNSPFLFEPYDRVANVVLPYLHLYQPTASLISLGLGIHKILTPKGPESTLAVAATVFQLGFNYVSPVGGAILSSGTLLGKQVYHMGDHLLKWEWSQFGKEFLKTMITTVHLFAIFNGSPAVISLSIALRSLEEFNESYSSYKEGNWPEALGSLALAVIHASSARPYISTAWRQYFSESLTSINASQVVEEGCPRFLQMTSA